MRYQLLAAFLVGMGLAAANYAALWFTVQKLVVTRRPMVLAFASFLLRTAAVISGFFYATAADPARLFACVFGFLLVRTLAVKRMAPKGAARGG
ncbi:MAG: ATP synthase subunit I [Geobacteraceae bacterium]|nr:ATP synthase subunit I [Geobacteraceae bacterium]